jgi:hypothetical protein
MRTLPPNGYAERVRAMSDAEYEEEVVVITDAAARSSVYCQWDAMAAVLREDRQRRANGAALYNRGHRRMVGGVMVERALHRAEDYVANG